MQFVVMSSSRGTTFAAVMQAVKDKKLQAKCLGLVTDRADRGCVDIAKAHDLPVKVVERTQGESRETYDKKLDAAITELGEPEVICALGWMWLLYPGFISKWRGKILNVHPALLPKHPGAHAIKETLDQQDMVTGMTIHVIDEGVDTGPIILQKSCQVLPTDTEETLKLKIQALEKEWYPKVLQDIATGDIMLRG